MKPVVFAAALAAASPALAVTPAELLAGYEAAARKAAPSVSASPQRGEQFFNSRHGGQWSCATCHGAPPVAPGKHATTGKAIAPLAPAASPERFTDAARTEKWFRRNCNDVLSRECTSTEKADVLAYLLRVRP